MAETLKLTPHESVTIKSSTPDVLEVEAGYAPGAKPPPKHWHPAQDERFRVLEGRVQVRTPGVDRILEEGETIEIPRETVHQMWNPAASPARVLWQTMPAGRTESWFRAIDRLHREGRVRGDGMPGPLAFGVMLTEYDDVFRLDARPGFLVRPALRALGLVGRFRGYSPHPD